MIRALRTQSQLFLRRSRNSPQSDYPADRCLALALLTDDPEQDDNGENDVVQEPTERVHAALTAVILANSPRPDTPRFSREIIGSGLLLSTRYIGERANVQEFQVDSLLGLLCCPSFLPSFLSSVRDSPLSSLPVSLPPPDIDSTAARA